MISSVPDCFQNLGLSAYVSLLRHNTVKAYHLFHTAAAADNSYDLLVQSNPNDTAACKASAPPLSLTLAMQHSSVFILSPTRGMRRLRLLKAPKRRREKRWGHAGLPLHSYTLRIKSFKRVLPESLKLSSHDQQYIAAVLFLWRERYRPTRQDATLSMAYTSKMFSSWKYFNFDHNFCWPFDVQPFR